MQRCVGLVGPGFQLQISRTRDMCGAAWAWSIEVVYNCTYSSMRHAARTISLKHDWSIYHSMYSYEILQQSCTRATFKQRWDCTELAQWKSSSQQNNSFAMITLFNKLHLNSTLVTCSFNCQDTSIRRQRSDFFVFESSCHLLLPVQPLTGRGGIAKWLGQGHNKRTCQLVFTQSL